MSTPRQLENSFAAVHSEIITRRLVHLPNGETDGSPMFGDMVDPKAMKLYSPLVVAVERENTVLPTTQIQRSVNKNTNKVQHYLWGHQDVARRQPPVGDSPLIQVGQTLQHLPSHSTHGLGTVEKEEGEREGTNH